jgi:hypothetical protein
VLDQTDVSLINLDEWSQSVYGDVKEEMSNNSPKPCCSVVTLTQQFDASLYREFLTGRSVIGIPHVVNQMPYDWFCKKPPTVKTATFGSECGTSRTFVRQIADIRLHFGHLGVPVIEHRHVFGDNDSMIKSAIWSDAKLHERYVALSFHRVKEGMATDKMTLTDILSNENPANVLSKHWNHNEVWKSLPTLLLFWRYNGTFRIRGRSCCTQGKATTAEQDLIVCEINYPDNVKDQLHGMTGSIKIYMV